jgi:DNA modification methylase
MIVHCKHDKLVNADSLKPHTKNRNNHPDDQIDRLAKILAYQGIRAPIVVSNLSGFIVKGHGTLMAIKKNGWDQAPVVYQDFDNDEQEYAFVQSDNAVASWAELDISGINSDIGELGPDFDIDLLGIRDFVLEIADKLEPQCDEDHVPEHVEPKSRPGDIYPLGRHRLICGDSTILTDVQKLMGTELADMVWTDPPYNVAYEGKTKDALKIKNDSMSGENFYQFLHDAHSNMLLHTKPGCAIYVAHADLEGMNFRKALTESGWLLKQCLVWVKNSLVMGRQDYHWKHEPILYGWAPGAAHNWYSDRKQSTVIECKRPTRSAEHPTMKPVELIEYCVANSCPPGGLILDLFGGSGSTLIAAEKNGRRAFLCELDPRYADVIVARWEKYTGKKAELLNG